MLDDEFIKQFEEFKFVERGWYTRRLILYDNHNLNNTVTLANR